MQTMKTQLTEFAINSLNGKLGNCPNCGQFEHAHTATDIKTKQTYLAHRTVSDWCYFYDKFTRYYSTGKEQFSVFVKGNNKLPFWAFSALPAVTCPGAGDCLNWCYSFKAWRYPASFFRQLQNTLMIADHLGSRNSLEKAFQKLPAGQTVRLYVDGDFDSMDTMKFWFDQIKNREDLNVYGYSKSWALFLQYDQAGNTFPANYTLNLSSGSKYGKHAKALMEKLPITRGEFVAVDMSESEYKKAPVKAEDPQLWAKFAAAVKRTATEQGIDGPKFVCPGKCYDCLPNGQHACGSDRFQDVNVLIATH